MVYLLHFNTRYYHAGHYIGSTDSLPDRLQAHELGRGARLTEVVAQAGITWQLARVWRGGRKLERRLKNQKHGPRLCPFCNPRLRKL